MPEKLMVEVNDRNQWIPCEVGGYVVYLPEGFGERWRQAREEYDACQDLISDAWERLQRQGTKDA